MSSGYGSSLKQLHCSIFEIEREMCLGQGMLPDSYIMCGFMPHCITVYDSAHA